MGVNPAWDRPSAHTAAISFAVVHGPTQQRLGMPGSVEDFEVDMLELARDYDADPEGSRLSCQIILTEKLEGLTIKLPNGTTNYMDHLPFE
jgi:hypothetical protein